jgi:hypothetical protein
MPAKWFAVLMCAFVLSLAVTGPADASVIFFDLDADSLPEMEATIPVGQTFAVSLYLIAFTEQTGSFQFDLFYDGSVLALLDYDTYVGQPDEDPGLVSPIQTLAELGPWATSQWSQPVTQELNELDSGSGLMREFYTAGSFTETATGDGVLVHLVFEATAVGQTTLALEPPGGTWILENASAQPIIVGLTVTVIPEPAVLTLLLLPGALLLGRAGRSPSATESPS